MTAFHRFKKLPLCKICGGEVDTGSMCERCKDRIKKEKKKIKS